MKLDLYQIDAFTNELFGGNLACVVPLSDWLADEVLLRIAQENAVAETAFLVEQGDYFHLRWFTPDIEMDLCGHATLAAAHALHTIRQDRREHFVFATASGELTVTVAGDRYTLDFPARKPLAAKLPAVIGRALNIQPTHVLKSRDYVLVYEMQEQIRNLRVNRALFDQLNLDPGGVVVTAKGEEVDFVSRYFTPQASILEDPVTGSAHCSLIPYWSEQLQKPELVAWQLSARGGTLYCMQQGERVLIGGQARTYSIGTCWIA
ncbi:PhzF family phenazine biosynthesis protein [Hymenobacter crusticola]|uniref:Isomerase n=1 Tax=Hymenobacter crusticola TaxID=1770526 RepID=A0A243W6K8_9BACT|nr:PhzF family phenazine biosynthesis protein [Hymenobacter crusticola]OUJ70015.1 isomerase [Hymenobacter crusticola]